MSQFIQERGWPLLTSNKQTKISQWIFISSATEVEKKEKTKQHEKQIHIYIRQATLPHWMCIFIFIRRFRQTLRWHHGGTVTSLNTHALWEQMWPSVEAGWLFSLKIKRCACTYPVTVAIENYFFPPSDKWLQESCHGDGHHLCVRSRSRMNVAPVMKSIISGIQIFLDHRSLSSKGQKILMMLGVFVAIHF